MDAHVKEGQLYVQHLKFGKKWKKNWFVLYPASQNGIARLEFFDSHGGGGSSGGSSGGVSNEKTRKLDKKIIRLSECISILPALIENCPKDNMTAFCVETNYKTYVFAAEKTAAKEWMDMMCDIAFKGGGSSCCAADASDAPQEMQMSENLIYYSREEVNEFWVTVQRTEASDRCRLAGNYCLKADKDALILKDPKTKKNVLVWPYKLLRRYGRDRVMFSFEAGRRCDSGPGSFTFDTKQGNEIFALVAQAIQSQKALEDERHLSYPTSFESDTLPSLHQLRNNVAMPAGGGDSSSSSSREADGDSGGSKPGSADGILGKREGSDGGRAAGGAGNKGRSLPEPPAKLGILVRPGHGAAKSVEPAGFYSEPVDSVRLHLQNTDSFYSDPVDTIKDQSQSSSPSSPLVPAPRLRPVGVDTGGGAAQSDQHRKPPDLYSHVYDRINMDLSQKTGMLSLDEAGGSGRGGSSWRAQDSQAMAASSPPAQRQEHIYDEPEGCAQVNIGMSIYDEARLEPFGLWGAEEAGSPISLDGEYDTPTHRQSPPQVGQERCPPRWPKPSTAPKPSRFARKDPEKHGSNLNNNNNQRKSSEGGEGVRELYSKVSKHKPGTSWYKRSKTPPLRSPDIIYDNLGDI
ncbi:docking protein 1b [Synchiropus splendidus]|uniref:docking protein 1b n=1 Tax=Synchiropus splendidus TaxID=270530 RepID=UPI00237E351F|nr:docking protein 1b [Synchiropus splendidus]